MRYSLSQTVEAIEMLEKRSAVLVSPRQPCISFDEEERTNSDVLE